MNRLLADRKEEKPVQILYNKDRETLLRDVLDKKRDAYFKPKYVIAPLTKLAQPRPQEFEGGFEDWFNDMRKTHTENIKAQIAAKKDRERWLMTLELDYAPKIMKRFLKVE